MDLRVFLVEDMETTRALLGALFDAIGGVRVVGTAGTEAEAKLWMDDNVDAWDVAVVDLVLDQGSGMEVVRYARRHWPAGRVLVFSSYASAGIRSHCLALGAEGVFDKGDPHAFIAWFRDAAAGRALRS